MSKSNDLLKQYEEGKISANKLFKEQDIIMTKQLAIGCGAFVFTVLMIMLISFILWFIGGN